MMRIRQKEHIYFSPEKNLLVITNVKFSLFLPSYSCLSISFASYLDLQSLTYSILIIKEQ